MVSCCSTHRSPSSHVLSCPVLPGHMLLQSFQPHPRFAQFALAVQRVMPNSLCVIGSTLPARMGMNGNPLNRQDANCLVRSAHRPAFIYIPHTFDHFYPFLSRLYILSVCSYRENDEVTSRSKTYASIVLSWCYHDCHQNASFWNLHLLTQKSLFLLPNKHDQIFDLVLNYTSNYEQRDSILC